MATLDQLPAEQRAIVELVVQRGRSYETLADVLQVPSERVRELARDALSELSPRTASRVDADRRGQIADYLLGQQSEDEERSTRDYLKGSETARAWALSLLDSLDPLYANGASPPVPEPDGEAAVAEPEAAAVDERPTEPRAAVPEAVPRAVPAAEPEPEPEPETKAEAVAEEPAAAAPETAEDRVRTRERERARKRPLREAEAEPAAAGRETEPARRGAALSPEAQSALRRRRIIGAGAGLAVVAVIVLALAGAFSSDKKKSTSASSGSTTSGTSTTPAQQQVQVLGGIALSPVGKTKAQGVAYIVQQGSQRYVVVQAQVPPLPNNQKVAAYEVWLYNSNADARSLGAQYTNAQGVLQGRAPLPADVTKFKAIDISRELFADKNAGHGNSSVLRGTFASIKPVPQQPQQGATTPTTPTTPGP